MFRLIRIDQVSFNFVLCVFVSTLACVCCYRLGVAEGRTLERRERNAVPPQIVRIQDDRRKLRRGH